MTQGQSSNSRTITKRSACGNVVVTIAKEDNGRYSLFARFGKEGVCGNAMVLGIAKSIGIGLQNGAGLKDYAENLENIVCQELLKAGKEHKLSCPSTIGKIITEYLGEQSS